jgi:hypothetical protein
MALSDPILWRRLEAFEVSPAEAVFSFAKRLARENRWSLAHAERVFAEYRRFLYLCMIAGRPMTPADAVDQAWHLHLTYSRSYWQELCRKVLGRPLHHEPTRGGPAERARFEGNYRATLAAYEREFGHAPPAEIWPDPAIRFVRAGTIQRIDTREHLVLDRRRLARLVSVALILVLPLALAACELVEFDAEGWHLTTAGVWLLALLGGFPLLVAIQRGFLNPACREPKRRGWFGIESGGCGCGEGDGGCSGCGGCSD